MHFWPWSFWASCLQIRRSPLIRNLLLIYSKKPYGSYHFYWEGGRLFVGGNQNFGGGEAIFFSGSKGATRLFFRVTEGDLIIFYLRGCSFTGRGQIFFCIGKWGTRFFAHAKGGTEYSFAHVKEGPEKMTSGDQRQKPPPIIIFLVISLFNYCGMLAEQSLQKYQSVLMFTWVLPC